MRRLELLSFCGFCLILATVPAHGAGMGSSPSRFYYRDGSGRVASAPIIHRSTYRIVHPGGKVDPRIDPKLRRAANIAEERARSRTGWRCWQYVKEALFAAGAVKSYPQSAYASEAGEELVQRFGFTRLSIRDPYAAPVGAVLVYGGRGHVEIRTRDGFVSDYHSNNRCFFPLKAIYGKF